MVTFELFVRPILEALAGLPPRKLAFLNARLKSDIKTKTGLTRFLPAVLSGEFEHVRSRTGAVAGLRRHRVHDSGQLLRRGSPRPRTRFAAGEWVPVLMR